MLQLLIHQLKEKQRSPFWQKSILLNILLGVIGLYLLLNVLAIGYFADSILQEIYKDRDVIHTFTGLLFYYLAFDLIIRFLLQQLPALSIQPYLTLPIRKKTLLHYPLLKSLFSFFNVLGLLLVLPFFVKVVCHTHPPLVCIAWIIGVVSCVFTNNFLTFSLKKYFSNRPIRILIVLIMVGALLYLDLNKIVSISEYFATEFLTLAKMPAMVILPIILPVFAYLLAYRLLKNNSYIEDRVTSKRGNTSSFTFFNRYGEIGELMRLELKLILRNKRPKSMFYLSFFFLLYGFLFYQQENLNDYLVLILTGFILTSIMSINHGQLMFSWDSSFFDSYLANNVSPGNYIKSKYLFFAMTCLGAFLLTLPYAIISYKIALINTALVLYNIGISSFLLMFFCTSNTSRIDLGRGQFMNYQGMGATQFLVFIPIMGLPAVIHLLFEFYGLEQYSFYVLGVLGIVGIIFNNYLLQIVVDRFVNRKYRMALGFRKK